MRPFDVKRLHSVSFGQPVPQELRFGRAQVPKTRNDAFFRRGDDGGEKSSDARSKQLSNRAGDILGRNRGVVEIDTCKPVHLEVDKPGCYILLDVRRRDQLINGRDGQPLPLASDDRRTPGSSSDYMGL